MAYYHKYKHQYLQQQKITFLPMLLCSRSSIKDVVAPLTKSKSFSSNDPFSPKIGCMGQVKRSNKIAGFPSSTTKTITCPTNSAHKHAEYLKLKPMYSGKRKVVVSEGRRSRSNDDKKEKENSACVINIENMDPPLPVIKRARKPAQDGEESNLWKRRSGGVGLTRLLLQEIQANRHNLV